MPTIKETLRTLRDEAIELRAQLKTAHRDGFDEGAASATKLAYLAISDYGFDGVKWLQDRMSAVAKKKPARSAALDERITRAVIATIRKLDPKRAAEIEASFAEFLSGESK